MLLFLFVLVFTSAQFDETLGRAMPALVAFALLSLCLTSLKALTLAFSQSTSGVFSKITSILSTLLYIVIAACLFADSLVSVLYILYRFGQWKQFFESNLKGQLICLSSLIIVCQRTLQFILCAKAYWHNF